MIMGSAIRHLATSNRRDIFLAALFEKTVYVWSIATGIKVAEFSTILDYGGRRLALGNAKDVFIAGAYSRNGVACYRLTNGEMIWHRKDLKGVQVVCISPNDKMVFCGFSDKPGHILDMDSGATLQRLKSVRDLFFDPYQGWFVHDELPNRTPQHSSLDYQTEVFDSKGCKAAIIPRCQLYDAAFSPGHVALSIGGINLVSHNDHKIINYTNDIHFVSRHDHNKIIIYRSPETSYVLHLAYCPNAEAFYGIGYNRLSRPSLLLRFDHSLEKTAIVTEIVRSDYAFCNGGEHLITSDGQLINTIAGTIEKEFDFPQTEYQTYGSDRDE